MKEAEKFLVSTQSIKELPYFKKKELVKDLELEVENMKQDTLDEILEKTKKVLNPKGDKVKFNKTVSELNDILFYLET